MIEHLLNTELTILRASYVTDAVGGRTKTFAENGTVRAMIAQPSAMERSAAAQLGTRLDFVVYTAPGADVERGDEFEDPLAPELRRLRVVGVLENSRETYTRLHCTVAQGE